MPKAVFQDIVDEGFRPEQFGSPDDWDATPAGYIGRVLAEAARWTAAQLGGQPVYDGVAANTYAADCIANAEMEWAKATLWRRRAAFIDSAANISLGEGQHLVRREYFAHATAADAKAGYYIDEINRALGSDVGASMAGTGASLGVVESGRYAPVLP